MKAQKVGKMAIFSVGAVLFSAHAGGGFATGNQANTYYVGIGWTGIVSAIIAMLLSSGYKLFWTVFYNCCVVFS